MDDGLDTGVQGRVWGVEAVGVHQSADPVVVDGLVGMDQDRIPLSNVNRETLDLNGLHIDTIGFNDCQVMVIDRELEVGKTSSVDDTNTIGSPCLEIEQRHGGAIVTLIACGEKGLSVSRAVKCATAVDNTAVGDGLGSFALRAEIPRDEGTRIGVIMVGDHHDNILLIICKVRFIWAVDDQRAIDTVDVL
jgi:hypothetical protein